MQVDIVSDKPVWDDALAALGEYDFTHTFDFHRISMANGEGEPLAFVARGASGRALAIWPVLKRSIPGTDLFDFSSVYGYAGPIVHAAAESISTVRAVLDAMRHDGGVSLFSRMHPLFMDRLDEESRGDRLGEVVVVDVGSSEDVLHNYRGGHRREIVNAHAKGVTVSVESGPAAVADFHNIYNQAMTGLEARQYYFFDCDYLSSMEAASDFETFILFANLDGLRIAASMFVVTGSLMQYYLSGTVAEFRKLAPSKVILAEAHRLAVRKKLKHFVLGGGVGSGQDALLSFKKGFSQLSFPFHVTRRILDRDKYSALCAERSITPADVQFFPAYRFTAAID